MTSASVITVFHPVPRKDHSGSRGFSSQQGSVLSRTPHPECLCPLMMHITPESHLRLGSGEQAHTPFFRHPTVLSPPTQSYQSYRWRGFL